MKTRQKLHQAGTRISRKKNKRMNRIRWDLIKTVTSSALSKGSLKSLPTTFGQISGEDGAKWVVRLATVLALKPTGAVKQQHEASKASDPVAKPNPFLPPDADLLVAPVLAGAHNLVLNKFNVVDYHLLLTTASFQSQLDRLNESDFASIWYCTAALEVLAFYNCGAESGASQPHKHVQLLPLPLQGSPPPWRFPTEPLLDAAAAAAAPGTIFRVAGWPFRHACCRVEAACERPAFETLSDTDAAEAIRRGAQAMTRAYDTLYQQLQLADAAAYGLDAAAGSNQHVSYNLIATCDWMCIMPRKHELYDGKLAVNATGLAGTLLAKTDELMQLIETTGPVNILKGVGFADSA
eukprot:TRINITY_DN965_c0_g1_i1.p1 TRINITY_DN965_c0_g1~~TRINITY_DN965_c0_g1_i1.p1  ORF type:complete len:351 (-),score=96.73 TRINITY_DN965_c0_g1_i1:145-1197(-)